MSARPEALEWSVDNCTVGRAMEILGERWTFVVLREIANGIRRFDDMRVRTNIPRQVLTNRLALLVDSGVLRREPYQDPGARVRHEYRLTQMGFDLWPVIVAVSAGATAISPIPRAHHCPPCTVTAAPRCTRCCDARPATRSTTHAK